MSHVSSFFFFFLVILSHFRCHERLVLFFKHVAHMSPLRSFLLSSSVSLSIQKVSWDLYSVITNKDKQRVRVYDSCLSRGRLACHPNVYLERRHSMTPSGRSLPSITITDATPRRTPNAGSSSTLASTPASSSKGPTTTDSYRLLYRGAFSLPDSYLQLDGIAFSARLPSKHASPLQDSPSLARSDASARELMYNPLALALESMRGRQTLRFKGTVRLADVWTDDAGDVYMCVWCRRGWICDGEAGD